MDEVTVGIDVGTTAVKAVAADGDGEVLARARIPHRLTAPDPGRFEHDVSEAWVDGVLAAWDEVRADAGRPVAAVTVSAMVPSLCGVDSAGTPVTPGLLYGDARGRTPAGGADDAARSNPDAGDGSVRDADAGGGLPQAGGADAGGGVWQAGGADAGGGIPNGPVASVGVRPGRIVDFARLGPAAGVAVEQTVRDRRPCRVHPAQRGHHGRHRHRRHRPSRPLAHRVPSTKHAVDPRFGYVVLEPTRIRRRQPVRDPGSGQHLPVTIGRHRLHRSSPNINPNRHIVHTLTLGTARANRSASLCYDHDATPPEPVVLADSRERGHLRPGARRTLRLSEPL